MKILGITFGASRTGRSVVHYYTVDVGAIGTFDTAVAARLHASHYHPSIMLTKEAITTRVKELLSDQLGIDLPIIALESRIEADLMADSLDRVETLMAFEEEFDLDIPEEDANKIVTVGDCVDYLFKTLSPKDSTPPKSHTPEQVMERVTHHITEQLCCAVSTVMPGTDIFETLGADSLDMVELTMALEEEFGLELQEEETHRLQTPQQWTQFIHDRL